MDTIRNIRVLARRDFLRRMIWGAVLAGAGAPLLQGQAQSSARRTAVRSPDEFRKRLEGPILSLPVPFQQDFEVDFDGIRNIVRRATRYGVRIFTLTAGNSKYDQLSYDETKEVTRVLVEAVAGRGMVIAATGPWWTARAVDYARFSEEVGADAVQIMLPPRSGGEDYLHEYFREIAAATRLPLALHGNYSESLLRKLVEIDSVVAMKEDLALTYYIDRQIEFGDRLEIFGGGAENRFFVGYPYGSRAFYSTYTSFAPDISMKFWEAIRRDDLRAAVAITTRYDHPFIKRFSHPFWHATLEHFGVAQRYLRPPQKSFTDEEMASVKSFFDGQGLDPADYRGA